MLKKKKMKNQNSNNANKKNLLQLIFLRVLAISGQMIAIFFAENFLEIELPQQMYLVISALLILNLISFYRYQYQKIITNRSLFSELIFDVAALTAQLYFSGGISNPFISLFLLQVIIAAILLRASYAWIIAAITVGCYVWLSFNFIELDLGDESFFDLHLHGMLISYVVAAFLLLIFITQMSKNLRQQQEFLRSAMLATAAAHDLGTPLNTISVVLDDLKNSEAHLRQDILLMESQVERCKKAVSNILEASGSERLEEAKGAD